MTVATLSFVVDPLLPNRSARRVLIAPTMVLNVVQTRAVAVAIPVEAQAAIRRQAVQAVLPTQAAQQHQVVEPLITTLLEPAAPVAF